MVKIDFKLSSNSCQLSELIIHLSASNQISEIKPQKKFFQIDRERNFTSTKIKISLWRAHLDNAYNGNIWSIIRVDIKNYKF